MPADQQVKLLRILETRTFYRLGGKQLLNADFRLISATNREAEQAVRENRLRLDLYHRLNTFPVTLPPLRARGDDIVLLAQRFLDELNAAEATSKHFAPRAHAALTQHSWPGNVRELRNVIQRAYILADDVIESIEYDNFSAEPIAETAAEIVSGTAVIPAGTPLADAERKLIEAAMVDSRTLFCAEPGAQCGRHAARRERRRRIRQSHRNGSDRSPRRSEPRRGLAGLPA